MVEVAKSGMLWISEESSQHFAERIERDVLDALDVSAFHFLQDDAGSQFLSLFISFRGLEAGGDGFLQVVLHIVGLVVQLHFLFFCL